MADKFSKQFENFSKFGDTKSDGTMVSLKQIDKWLKQAKVIDGKKISATDTGITFSKLFKQAKTISLENFKSMIADLAKQKGLKNEDLIQKLTDCGDPGTTNVTQAVHVGGVDRLTDVAGYTGAHKERFDADGKGKGLEGREDVKANDGYVSGYKEKDTYDQKKS